MPENWDPIVYRQRAEAWRQRAALLPEDDPQATTCLEIADGYGKLADLIEARQRPARAGVLGNDHRYQHARLETPAQEAEAIDS